MSAPFVTQLRTRRPAIELASGPGTITIRVEASEIWETVRVVATRETRLSEVKERVLDALLPGVAFQDDYVLKLHGWEMLDHDAPLGETGVVDGSILLLARRRRRTVR